MNFLRVYCVLLILGGYGLTSSRTEGQTYQDPVIAEIEEYMSNTKTFQANFTQISNNGVQATGVIYLSRPGRMRVEYDPPINDYIVADSVTLYHWDDELKQESRTSQEDTLADFLLRDELRFTDDVTILSLVKYPHAIEITITQTTKPEQGKLTLGFQRSPMTLNRWVVVDAQGLKTEIVLDNIKTGLSWPRSFFYFYKPEEYR